MALSDAGRAAVYARFSDKVLTVCLTLRHPTLAEPLRLCTDNAPVARTVDGGGGPVTATFHPFPMDITMPGQDPRQPTRTTISIHTPTSLTDEDGNPLITDPVTGRALTLHDVLRGLRPAPTLDLEVVLADEPDEVEMGPLTLRLNSRESTTAQIVGDFDYGSPLDEAWPGDTITPATHPGAFQ